MFDLRFLSIAEKRRDKPTSTDTAEEEKEEESRDRLCNTRGKYSCRIWDACASLKHGSQIWDSNHHIL